MSHNINHLKSTNIALVRSTCRRWSRVTELPNLESD